MADRPPYSGTPRWLKVFGIIAIVLILLFVVIQFTGVGGHGPGRHTPSGEVGVQALSFVVTEVRTLSPDGHG